MTVLRLEYRILSRRAGEEWKPWMKQVSVLNRPREWWDTHVQQLADASVGTEFKLQACEITASEWRDAD